MRRLGVDEAGKGPVLGAMVAVAVLADPDTLPASVADSKTLQPEERHRLDTAIRSAPDVDIGVAHIPVAAIDDPATNMNDLTVAAHAAAIRAVPDDIDEAIGCLDASDVDADRFARRVTDHLDPAPTLDAAHGADEADPLVAAASILAKVARDAHIDSLAAQYETDLGSGYPSDSVTRSFLETHVETHGALPPCARRSWRTSRDVLRANGQTDLAEF